MTCSYPLGPRHGGASCFGSGTAGAERRKRERGKVTRVFPSTSTLSTLARRLILTTAPPLHERKATFHRESSEFIRHFSSLPILSLSALNARVASQSLARSIESLTFFFSSLFSLHHHQTLRSFFSSKNDALATPPLLLSFSTSFRFQGTEKDRHHADPQEEPQGGLQAPVQG